MKDNLILRLSVFMYIVYCPHTPTQNGGGERKNRHVIKARQAMIMKSNVLMMYWDLSFKTTIHIINRLPSKVFNYTYPYELLFKAKLDYTHLNTFGCL